MAERKWHDLKDTHLPRLLHTISLRSDPASIMDVIRGMLKRRIYFKKGWPVNASSNSMSDVLGRVMLEEGIISEEAYEKSLEIMLKQKKRHGEALISMGFISQKELDDCLALQMKKKIWKIFGWPDGNYKYFLIKGGLPANLQLLPMNPASLIINGILNGYCPFEQVEAELKKFIDKPLIVSPNKPYKIEDLGLNIQESRFLAEFDGTDKTRDVINNSDLLRRKAELLTYGLIITDIISSKDEAVAGVAGSILQIEPEYSGSGYKPEPAEGAYVAAKKVDAELIFQNGKTYLAKKDYEKAVTAFEDIVRLNPDEAEYKAYLGWAIFSKDPKNIERAKNLFMESLSSNPDMDMAHLFLARLYIKEGLFKEAEGGLTAALRKNPFLPEARKELALIRIRSGSDVHNKGYVDYFHLTQNPFDLLPDPDFLYLGDAHSEALYFLLNNIKSGIGNIILLTGKKGSGKTSLCLKTMEKLEAEKIVFVYIDSLNLPIPPLAKGGEGGLDVLITIKNELGIKTATDFADEVISALHAHFSGYSAVKGRIIIILDNAHKLNNNALRAVKRLLDFRCDNIIISGQPETEDMLNAPDLKEIAQTVSGIHRLHPLGHDETREYIFKKLALAGGEKKLQITPWAIKTIHNASFGNPEMVNKICDGSLDLAMKKAVSIIDEQIIKAVEGSIGMELDEKLPQVEPVEEKVGALSEEEARKIISGQIAAAAEEAVKKEFEKRAPQFDPASVVDEVVEKVKKLINEQTVNMIGDAVKSEINKRAAQPDTHDALNETIEKAEKPFEEQARQITDEQVTSATDVSFEIVEKKKGVFAKNGFLIKTLIIVIAAGTILAVIANYNILQEINLFSGSNAPVPVKKVEPVNLPATEPPAIKAVPPEVQHAPEDKTVLPEAVPEAVRQAPDRNIQRQARLLTITFEINGSRKETVFNSETFKVKRGDKIKIVSADVGDIPANDIVVNLLGFTGDKNKNTGEDRGYLIDTARDMWKKYSTDGKGSEYPIVVKYEGEKIGSILLKIME